MEKQYVVNVKIQLNTLVDMLPGVERHRTALFSKTRIDDCTRNIKYGVSLDDLTQPCLHEII
jgi:hypothetical protein